MQKTKLSNYIRKILLFLSLYVAVSSCASHIFINISSMEQADYILEFADGSLQQLSAVCSENMCKFIVFDTLGMPIVSKEYSNNKFHSVKFLPPNSKYDVLFAYIVENEGSKDKFLFNIGDKSITVYKNN